MERTPYNHISKGDILECVGVSLKEYQEAVNRLSRVPQLMTSGSLSAMTEASMDILLDPSDTRVRAVVLDHMFDFIAEKSTSLILAIKMTPYKPTTSNYGFVHASNSVTESLGITEADFLTSNRKAIALVDQLAQSTQRSRHIEIMEKFILEEDFNIILKAVTLAQMGLSLLEMSAAKGLQGLLLSSLQSKTKKVDSGEDFFFGLNNSSRKTND